MATEEAPPPRGTASISSWYDCTTPRWIDLVGDYAGKELFLVEGDSLLRECFEDPRIDFKDGFQLLHAAYVVERFLDGLVKRHCNFHVAFFEENADLCIPRGLRATRKQHYLLARRAIIRHLSVHLSANQTGILVQTFPSLESDDFKRYTQTNPIHFVMCHDGALKPDQTETEETQEGDTYAKILLRGNIFWFNSHKLNVALINRIEFRDSKVFTMIVESVANSREHQLVKATALREGIKDVRKALSDLESHDSDDVASNQGMEKFIEACSDSDLTERLCLSVYAVSEVLKNTSGEAFLASAFMTHAILLKHITLSQRRLPFIKFDSEFEAKIQDFLENFSRKAQGAMNSAEWDETIEDYEIECDTIDLVDGRLFRAVIQEMCQGSLANVLGGEIKEDWKLISSLVAKRSGRDLALSGSSDPISSEMTTVEEEQEPLSENLAVLPFSNEVFDKHLNCIHVDTDNSIQARLGAMRLYRETTHWHNHKKPLNPKLPPAQKVSKWRNPLRTNQFYMKEMTAYAASLTGATGKALDAETITVGPKKLIKIAEENPAKSSKPERPGAKSKVDDSKENKKPTANAKKGTKKAASGLSKKDQMIADNKERKGSAESDKVFTAWTTVMKNLDVNTDDQDRYLKTMAYLKSLDSTKTAYLEAEIYIYIVQSLLNWWAGYCKTNKKTQGYHVVALIWTTVRSICTSSAPITKEIIQHTEKVCKILEITDALSPLTPSGVDRKLSFVFKYPPNADGLRIGLSQVEFQLKYCGPYMDRMLDAKPDPRVSNFVPDGWQRDVLDQLDANKSVFVVAPTSAGKTFISFYAMEQILRADNDGVLVYVAPTKALVNQIAAEVQGRFSKKFPQPGKGVWAIHTRDYRINNSTGCQILVTVPHVLQIMLMSPTNAKSWAPRVRRIIFDEIHSIGQAEDGVVWEQLLLLAPCPIIALSATVGNPKEFNDWLVETQKSSGSELKMIQHSTRYSDLRKYMYEPPSSFEFKGLGESYGVGLGLDGLVGFEPFHPVASLVDKSRGMPDDLALEPRDCYSLWQTMCKLQTDKYQVPASLDPVRALPSCVRKKDIFAWEKSLKAVLLDWMNDEDSPFDKVVAALTNSGVNNVPEETTSALSPASGSILLDKSDLEMTTLPLLFQLHKRRALPAILFNYDRSGCEKVAFQVLAQLVAAETEWKQGSQWKKKMDGYAKYQEQKEKKSQKTAKPSKKSKSKDDEDDDAEGSKADRERDELSSQGVSIYDSFDPEAPLEDFSFANHKNLLKTELNLYIWQLRRKGIPQEFIDLLRRGVGVHHSGMNRKYRQCVEMLFRKGFLKVVIATGTLSLGINMPCATVVFSGDSVFLTALNFRQAAGRSGRRGFDLLGNVVFQGITKERACRLLSSRLPELTGHFPFTTTLVLRLFTLLNDSKNSQYAIKAINSLLSQPRLYLGGQSFKEQVLHHLRFSIEYLRRNELLGPNGEPINFTSCVSHLYYTENSSFAFHALLKGGYFHDLCEDIDRSPTKILQQLMLVLSHIFGRRVTREVDDLEAAEKIKHSPSIVYLPSMPDEAAYILREHNRNTLDIFTTYVKTFTAQHITDDEHCLPLTLTPVGRAPKVSANGKAVNGHASSNGTAHPNGASESAVKSFLPSLPSPKARSAFVALSGLGDDFKTIEDLCSSTRDGVFLEAAVIPHLELHPDETKSPLNAYLLDFFMHGSIVPLEEANGIRKSDVWFVLNDFSLVLATITTSLALYLGLGGADPEMLDIMGTGDAAENDDDEAEAEVSIPESTSTVSTPTQPLTFAKKGKKVADDWDTGEDAIAAEEDFLKKESAKATSVSDDEEYEKLMNVYKAFSKLKTEFNAKFMAIWA